jgi:hypothetical protein
MKTNQGTKTPKQASDEFLNAMAEFVNNTYGAKKALAEALTARTGEHVARERIERWLHRDPEQRQQPLLGSALLMAEVFSEVKRKTKTKTRDTNDHGNRTTTVSSSSAGGANSAAERRTTARPRSRHRRERAARPDHSSR